jgi:organic hydroperoxide reductase OsmC/OhrA
MPVPQQPQLTDMSYRARVESLASAADVERLHAAVEESCPVLNTLRNPITVTRTQG